VKTLVLDPRVEELLRIVQRRIGQLNVDYAVGGAIAMAMQGYARHTSDVDVFVLREDCPQVLAALRDGGLEVATLYEDAHYVATLPKHGDVDIRIDVLVPPGEPDLSAVEYPREMRTDTGVLPIVQANLLAAQKFYANRDKDESDLRAMYRRGVINAKAVGELIHSFDPEGSVEWAALIRRFDEPRVPRKLPPRKT
jgi:hypothetical protein